MEPFTRVPLPGAKVPAPGKLGPSLTDPRDWGYAGKDSRGTELETGGEAVGVLASSAIVRSRYNGLTCLAGSADKGRDDDTCSLVIGTTASTSAPTKTHTHSDLSEKSRGGGKGNQMRRRVLKRSPHVGGKPCRSRLRCIEFCSALPMLVTRQDRCPRGPPALCSPASPPGELVGLAAATV